MVAELTMCAVGIGGFLVGLVTKMWWTREVERRRCTVAVKRAADAFGHSATTEQALRLIVFSVPVRRMNYTLTGTTIPTERVIEGG